jgi:hypothetical protein
VVEDRNRLAEEFTAILGRIRELEGFGSFGLPPTIEELVAEAALGPVVVFNVSAFRCDALVVTGEGVISVALPDLTYDAVVDRADDFHQAVSVAADRDVDPEYSRGPEAGLDRILEWLWDTAAAPVLRALGYHNQPPRGAAWPRVWWAPGGLLGLLPVHAAGYHTDAAGDPRRRTVMDRVISSYTPTVRALRYARQAASRPTIKPRALIVAMPTTPGVSAPLDNARAEADRIAARLPGSVVLVEPDLPSHDLEHVPTKANVLTHLPGCPIAHFACHGESDPTDPSKSLLLLHDHHSEPLTVGSLAPVRLDHAQLAYLSACHTASVRAAALLDEAIHLASAFQLAGYPHVIGTLWQIADAIAVNVADSFYSNLRAGDDTIDTNRSAQALHAAVRAVRDKYPATPAIWAPYLHAGA